MDRGELSLSLQSKASCKLVLSMRDCHTIGNFTIDVWWNLGKELYCALRRRLFGTGLVALESISPGKGIYLIYGLCDAPRTFFEITWSEVCFGEVPQSSLEYIPSLVPSPLPDFISQLWRKLGSNTMSPTRNGGPCFSFCISDYTSRILFANVLTPMQVPSSVQMTKKKIILLYKE